MGETHTRGLASGVQAEHEHASLLREVEEVVHLRDRETHGFPTDRFVVGGSKKSLSGVRELTPAAHGKMTPDCCVTNVTAERQQTARWTVVGLDSLRLHPGEHRLPKGTIQYNVAGWK